MELILSEQLKAQAQGLLKAFADPMTAGAELLRQRIKQKWGLTVDVDQTHLVTFHYTQVFGQPYHAHVIRSQTLTEALLANWQGDDAMDTWVDHRMHPRSFYSHGPDMRIVSDRESLFPHRTYEGVYTSSDLKRYGPDIQLPIAADELETVIWDVDFYNQYHALLDNFWGKHKQSYRDMTKAAFIVAVAHHFEQGNLSYGGRDLALKAASITHLEGDWEKHVPEQHVPCSSIHVAPLDIYGYKASDILVITNQDDGKVLIYVSGEPQPFHELFHLDELSLWVAQYCKRNPSFKALLSHFGLLDRQDGISYTGVERALYGIGCWPESIKQRFGTFYTVWNPATYVQYAPETITGDIFNWLTESQKARAYKDADTGIRSQADHNKAEALNYIDLASSTLGPLFMLVPMGAIPAVVLGISQTGLGLERTLHGKTANERTDGLNKTAMGALSVAPVVVAPMLKGAATEVNEDIPDNTSVALGSEHQVAPPESVSNPASAVLETSHVEPAVPPTLERIPEGGKLREPAFMSEFVMGEGGIYTSNRPEHVNRMYIFYRGQFVPVLRDEFGHLRLDNPFHSAMYRDPDTLLWEETTAGGLRGGADAPPPAAAGSGSSSQPGAVPASGESASVVAPVPAEPDLQVDTYTDPMTVDLPMDGVMTNKLGGHSVPIGGYSTPVIFDIQSRCWRGTIFNKPLVRSGESWRECSVEEASSQADRPSVRTRKVIIPSLPKVPSGGTPIPKNIHYVWVGEGKPNAGLLQNIRNNAAQSFDAAHNTGYRSIVHVDVDTPEVFAEIRDALHDKVPGLEVRNLNDSPFFARYKASKYGRFYDAARRGPNHNYSAAVDVLRYPLINEHGGIYLDFDDTIEAPMWHIELMARKQDVLLNSPVTNSTGGLDQGYNSSQFGSHPNNPVLEAIAEEAYQRFLQEPGFFDEPRPKLGGPEGETGAGAGAEVRAPITADQVTEVMDKYVKRVWKLCGPVLLNDVLALRSPTLRVLREFFVDSAGWTKDVSLTMEQKIAFRDALNYYLPFDQRVPIVIGAEHSWFHSR